MKDVKVLGPGCKRCIATAEMVQAEADRLGVPVTIEKVTDYAAIAGYGIASTPGVVIDGKVVHAGGLPKPEDLADGWAPEVAAKLEYKVTAGVSMRMAVSPEPRKPRSFWTPPSAAGRMPSIRPNCSSRPLPPA